MTCVVLMSNVVGADMPCYHDCCPSASVSKPMVVPWFGAWGVVRMACACTSNKLPHDKFLMTS